MIPGVEDVQESDQVTQPLRVLEGPAPRYRALYLWLYFKLNHYTKGHGAEVMRLGSFLFVGGLASLINLVFVWLFATYTHLPYDLYIVLATEISLLCNFSMNDQLTFRSLGNQRSWLMRCLRFHLPASVGFLLTLLISYIAHHVGHLPPVSAQAVAIIIVTFVNFAMHRLWTYRGVSSAHHHLPADAPLL
jgi:putative flippase GtrA